MRITLSQPELEKFVAQQITAGNFQSAEAVIEAGLARLMLDHENDALDDETLTAIELGNVQIERGEGIDFQEFAAAMRRKMAAK